MTQLFLSNISPPLQPFAPDLENSLDEEDRREEERLVNVVPGGDEEAVLQAMRVQAGGSGLLDSLLLPTTELQFLQIEDELLQVVGNTNDQLQQAFDEQQQAMGIFKSVAISLTTGVIAWATRFSGMLLALISSTPVWKGFDPLPILEIPEDKRRLEEKQRRDKAREDINKKEVGYLFDQATAHSTEKDQINEKSVTGRSP